MDFETTDKLTNEFGKKLVKASRANLTRGKNNANKSLWKSIKYRFEKNIFNFYYLDYGEYVDKGVTGHGKGDYKPRNPRPIAKSIAGYRFKKGPVGPSAKASFRKWAAAKNVLVRDSKGRFVKPDTANFLLRRSTGRFGIQPKKFFTNAWDKLYPKYSKDLERAITIDVSNKLDDSLKSIK
jgi:hypothetical protein